MSEDLADEFLALEDGEVGGVEADRDASSAPDSLEDGAAEIEGERVTELIVAAGAGQVMDAGTMEEASVARLAAGELRHDGAEDLVADVLERPPAEAAAARPFDVVMSSILGIRSSEL